MFSKIASCFFAFLLHCCYQLSHYSYHNMCSYMSDILFDCQQANCLQCDMCRVVHTDMTNKKTNLSNTAEMGILYCSVSDLHCNEIDLHSNMTQMTVFCFWTLSEVMIIILIKNSAESIDKIHQQHCHNTAAFVNSYFSSDS